MGFTVKTDIGPLIAVEKQVIKIVSALGGLAKVNAESLKGAKARVAATEAETKALKELAGAVTTARGSASTAKQASELEKVRDQQAVAAVVAERKAGTELEKVRDQQAVAAVEAERKAGAELSRVRDQQRLAELADERRLGSDLERVRNQQAAEAVKAEIKEEDAVNKAKRTAHRKHLREMESMGKREDRAEVRAAKNRSGTRVRQLQFDLRKLRALRERHGVDVINTEKRLTKALAAEQAKRTKRTRSDVGGFGVSGVAGMALGSLGGAGVAAAGTFYAARGATEFGREGARFEAMEASLLRDKEAVKALDDMMLQLDHTVTRRTAVGMLNLARTMKIPMDMIPTMAATARASALTLGEDMDHMLHSMFLGTARESRLILDNLGIIISETEAHKKYAEKVGTSVSKLSDAQKRIAFINEMLLKSADIIAAAPVASALDAMDRSSARIADSWDRIKKASAPLMAWHMEMAAAIITGESAQQAAFDRLMKLRKDAASLTSSDELRKVHSEILRLQNSLITFTVDITDKTQDTALTAQVGATGADRFTAFGEQRWVDVDAAALAGQVALAVDERRIAAQSEEMTRHMKNIDDYSAKLIRYEEKIQLLSNVVEDFKDSGGEFVDVSREFSADEAYRIFGRRVEDTGLALFQLRDKLTKFKTDRAEIFKVLANLRGVPEARTGPMVLPEHTVCLPGYHNDPVTGKCVKDRKRRGGRQRSRANVFDVTEAHRRAAEEVREFELSAIKRGVGGVGSFVAQEDLAIEHRVEVLTQGEQAGAQLLKSWIDAGILTAEQVAGSRALLAYFMPEKAAKLQEQEHADRMKSLSAYRDRQRAKFDEMVEVNPNVAREARRGRSLWDGLFEVDGVSDAEKEIALSEMQRDMTLSKLGRNAAMSPSEIRDAKRVADDRHMREAFQATTPRGVGGIFETAITTDEGTDERAAMVESLDQAIEPSTILAENMNSVTDAFADAGAAAILYGDNVADGVNRALNSIAREATARALFETGAAAASWALGPIGAPMARAHMRAAATFGLVAGVTALGAHLTGGINDGSESKTKDKGADDPRAGRSTRSDATGNVTYYISYNGFTSDRRGHEQLVNMINDNAGRPGAPQFNPRAVGAR